MCEVDTLLKSAKKRHLADVTNASGTRASDVNISAVSSTPASDVGDSTRASKRTACNAPSMPSVVEIPPLLEIPMADNDEQLVVDSASGDENIPIPMSSSNEAMVRSDISI